jgi:hypothetical protein
VYHSIEYKRTYRNCSTCFSPFRETRGSWKSLSPGRCRFLFYVFWILLLSLASSNAYSQGTILFGYDYEITLTISQAEGSEDLTDFPLLIRLDNPRFANTPGGYLHNVNGYDLIFVDEYRKRLDHQIEYYDPVNGVYVAWVRMPVLSHTSSTVIKMLYGNPSIIDNPSGTSVWSDSYKGVWHLSNNDFSDATSNGNDGTGIIGAPIEFIGGGRQLNGSECITIDSKPGFPSEFDNQTRSGWANIPSSGIPGWFYYTNIYNGTSTTYINGIVNAGLASYRPSIECLGRLEGSATYINGQIDEFRVSSDIKSPGWILTEFENQRPGSTFVTLGASAFLGYNYETEINVQPAEGDEDLIDFPLLINTTLDRLKHASQGGGILNSNGYDLIFTDTDYNRLDHEIQQYDPLSGKLIAWVRIPVLDSSLPTSIRMLYGRNNVTNNPSSEGTWNSNYAAVWHMADSEDDISDATSNNNDGTNHGTTDVDGKIGRGREFNGHYIQIPYDPSLELVNNQVTLQAWVLRPANALQDGPFIVKGSTMNQERYMLGLQNNTNRINTRLTTSSGHFRDDSDEVIPENIWTHLTFVYDGTLNTNPRKLVYKNGVLVDKHFADGIITNAITDQIHFGRRLGTDDRYFRGSLDEIRISKTARSPSWISTEFLNQNNPGAFVGFSEEETISGNLPSIGICEAPLLLDYGYPSGGVYSGDGVTDMGSGLYYFYPADILGNNANITYTFTDAHSVEGIITKTITVTSSPPAPVASNVVTCASNVANLEAQGINLKWYSDPGLGMVNLVQTGTPFMTGITTPGTHTFYVTQTKNGCESPAIAVTLEILMPAITEPPANLTVCAGQDASFSITATHADTYQWQRNGVNITDNGHVSGSSTNSLQLSNVSLYDAGEYRCLVTDVCGREAMVSDAAVLTVNPAPLVTFGYDYEKTITINQTMVSGTDNLIDFPVLIDTTDSDLRHAPSGKVQNNKGYDIVFSADGDILDHELEFYDPVTGKYTAWVRIPVLSATENTIIKIHYGNSLISTNPSSPNTWSSDYVGVWHMHNGNYRDATNNWNDGNAFGIDPIAAVIAEGGDFRNSGSIDDRIEIGNVDLTGDKLTLSAWINIRDFTTHDARIISKASSTDPDDHLWMLSTFNDGTDQKIRFRIKTSGSLNTEELLSTTTLSAESSTFVSGVYDGNEMRIYFNGGSSDNNISKTGDISSNTAIHAAIGNQPKLAWVLGNNSKRAFNGTLDEVRVINTARSANWLATEYNNQSDPSTYITSGTEISNPAHDFTVCLNDTIEYNTVPVPGATYLWEVKRGTITGVANASSVEVIWDNSGEVTDSPLIKLTVTLGTCISEVEHGVDFHPFVEPVITGPEVVCNEAAGVDYQVPFIENHTYLWDVNGGNIDGVATNNGVTIDWETSIPDAWVSVAQTSENGCINTDTIFVGFVSQPVAQTIIKSPDLEAVCIGEAVSATFINGSGGIDPNDIYEYSINGGAAWSGYFPGDPISSATAGASLLQIRTRRTSAGPGCIAAEGIPAVWTVTDFPNAPVAVNAVVTYNGTEHTASATAGAGETIVWYTEATEGTITTAPSGTNAGTYTAWAETVNATGCRSTTRTEVSLTISKAPLSITAENKTKLYDGSVFPTASYTVTYSGFVGGENQTDLSGTLAFSGTALAATDFGTYIITPGGLSSGNYEISYGDGELIINQKALTITADNQGKVYGEVFTFDGDEFTAVGLVNSDAITSVTLVSDGAPGK